MASILKQDREIIRQIAFNWLGDVSYKIADMEQYGEPVEKWYNDLYFVRMMLKALELAVLTTKEEEPILAKLDEITSTFPAGSPLINPS